MKIPFPDAKQEVSGALPVPIGNLNLNNLGGGLDNAIGQVGDAAKTIENKYEEEQKKAKDEADKIATANADAAYQHAETDKLQGSSNRRDLIEGAFNNGTDPDATDVAQKPGFYETRGLDASAQSAKALDDLEKARQDIAAKGFQDPEARDRWLARSAGMYEDSRRKIETHVYQQREVAADDALKGKLSTALLAVPGSDSRQVGRIGRDGAEAIRGLQRSVEGGDAAVAKWWSDVASAHVLDLVDQGQLDEAQAAFNGSKAALGKDAEAHVGHQLALAVKVRDQKQLEVNAQTTVDTAITVASNLEGKPQLDQLDEILAKVPPGAMKDEIEKRLPAARTQAIQRWKEKVDTYANAAGTTFEKTLDINKIDTKVKVWLQDNAPDEWKKIRHDAEAYDAYLRARMAHHREGIRAAKDNDDEARLAFVNAYPDANDRAEADVAAFLRGRGVTPHGVEKVKFEQTKAIGTVKANDAVGESEFVANVEAKTEGTLPVDPKERARRKDEIRAEAIDSYSAMREAAKGKPSKAVIDAEADRLTHVAATKPRGAWSKLVPFVSETLPEMEIEKQIREKKAKKGVLPAPGNQGAVKSIVGYKVSPDKKQRAPKYSDGTVGPIEQVP